MSFFSLMDGNWRVPKKFVNVLNIFYYEYLEFECVLGICSHIILSMLSKKYSVSNSPTNEVWIFMYKFIDFDHFQSMRGNQIFHKIMWFLLFSCGFFEVLVAGLLLQFVAESIRLLWIKWLQITFQRGGEWFILSNVTKFAF